MTHTEDQDEEIERFHRLVAEGIRGKNRGLIGALRIEACDGGVIVFGRTTSYYGKQIALFEVERQCRRLIVHSNIAVVKERFPARRSLSHQ